MGTKAVTYVLVEPATRRVTAAKFKTLQDAERAVGLDPDTIDHGALENGQGIVVYEHGLMEPVEKQHLFSIGKRLYAGPAVIYAEFEDKPADAIEPSICWYKNVDEAWQAIDREEIIQPAITVGGEVLWLWPEPKPTALFGEA